MTNPNGSFIWYELMTTDPDAAAAFYGAVVGWKITETPDTQGGVDYRHFIRSDGGSNGGVLRLDENMVEGGGRPCWNGYLRVADLDDAVAQIRADGGQVLMPKLTIEVGSFAMVTDPQGIPFYVMTPIAPSGTDNQPSDAYDRWTEQRISWNELYSPDLEAAKTFYTKHFGFEFNNSMPMGDMGDYCFIDHHGQDIGAFVQKPPHLPAGCWNHYIRVHDINAAKAAIEAGGGQVLNGPCEVPGGDWVINGMDPQGAAFSLVAAKGK
ncbi:MAG: VOC family protein [Novosphingobium sp.]|nr:VOC family protein [Novosphingobium sp.]